MSDKPKHAEIVRNAEQVQRAHDLLLVIICNQDLEEKLLGDDPEREVTVKCMKAAADVLCWVLGHANDNFADNLLELDVALYAAGIDIHDMGRLVYPEENGNGPLPS